MQRAFVEMLQFDTGAHEGFVQSHRVANDQIIAFAVENAMRNFRYLLHTNGVRAVSVCTAHLRTQTHTQSEAFCRV